MLLLSLLPNSQASASDSRSDATVGKPSLAFYQLAISSLPPSVQSHLAIIGDDKVQDIGKVPRELGLKRILVRTGKYREGDEVEVEVGNEEAGEGEGVGISRCEVVDNFADAVEWILRIPVVAPEGTS